MKFQSLFLIIFLLGNIFIKSQYAAYISKKNYDLQYINITIKSLTIVLNKNGIIENFYSNEINGDLDYYNETGYFEGFKKGKLKRIGNITLDYYDIWNKNNGNYDKFKKIGDIDITYWETFDKSKEMKVKMVGDILIDYWGNDIIDNSKFGKLKSIGDISIDYGITEATNQSRAGKLIKFGTVVLDFWNDTVFDKEKFGKLKSITGNTKDISVILQ